MPSAMAKKKMMKKQHTMEGDIFGVNFTEGESVPFGFDDCVEVSQWLKERTKIRPRIGIICGSGLGGLAEILKEIQAFNYADIPKFPTSTVSGHKGRLVFGRLGGQEVVCMQGRFHAYEGYPLMKCAFPVRVMRFLGATVMLVTNAAGGLNTGYKMGDIMVLKDHINAPGFCGNNPLKGPNDDRFGPRLLAMNHAYDKSLRELMLETADELGLTFIQEGTYVMLGGPTYETASEAKALRSLGCDAVGASVAHEVIIAVHCGMRVLGMSLITNMVIQEMESNLFAHHKEVLDTAANRAKVMQRLVTVFVSKMEETELKIVSERPEIDRCTNKANLGGIAEV